METPVSLLERLRRDPGVEPWQRLVELYSPLRRAWFRQYGLQPADVDDLVQEVLAAVVRELPNYEPRGRAGAFRTWLRLLVRHRLLTFWRTRRAHAAGADLDRLPEPEGELGITVNAVYIAKSRVLARLRREAEGLID